MFKMTEIPCFVYIVEVRACDIISYHWYCVLVSGFTWGYFIYMSYFWLFV